MVSRQICVYLREKKFNNKYNIDFLNMIYNLIALQAAGGNGAGIMNIGLRRLRNSATHLPRATRLLLPVVSTEKSAM